MCILLNSINFVIIFNIGGVYMSNEIINNLDSGTVHITEDVIASIASYEASNIDGVVNMSASITSGVVERISGKNPNKGITVNIEDANVYVNMRIIVEYGKNIIEICNNIQNRVKETIESMTNLNVVEVNITVDSVVIVKENREKTQ